MSYAPRITAIVSLAFVLGCEAPTDIEPVDLSSEASSFTAADGSERKAPPVYGSLYDGVEPVADASVCILYTRECTKSDKEGVFKLEGLLADRPEALFVFSPKHVPLIVPVQLRADEDRSFALELVPGDAFERTEAGRVQVQTELVSDEMDVRELGAKWGLKGGFKSNIQTIEAANGVSGELRPDIYVAQFKSEQDTHCIVLNGWSGPDAESISLPVLAGAMTYIEQMCILAD